MSSAMTLAPPCQIAVHAFEVREHRSLLARNHLPKHARFQAPRSRSNELAPKPLTSSDCRTVSLTMSRPVRKIPAACPPAAPRTINPMQRIARGFAARADHARSDSTLPPPDGRHRPLAQSDLDLDAGRRDHDAGAAGPGNPRERSAGMVLRPRQRERSPDLRDGSDGQARCVAGEASIWVRGFACSEAC